MFDKVRQKVLKFSCVGWKNRTRSDFYEKNGTNNNSPRKRKVEKTSNHCKQKRFARFCTCAKNFKGVYS